MNTDRRRCGVTDILAPSNVTFFYLLTSYRAVSFVFMADFPHYFALQKVSRK